MQRRLGGQQHIPRPDTWQHGPLPRWVHEPTPAPSAKDACDLIVAAALDQRHAEPLFADARASAVLVVLADGPLGAEVLLTKRSRHLRHHAGEISFPGGRMESGETAEQAALRETCEEVGLPAEQVRIRGQLSQLSTFVSRSYIVPLVAELMSDQRPALVGHVDEVERILWVPLIDLARRDTYRQEQWGTPPAAYPIHFFDLDDETIWGATGRMLFELLELVYGPPAIRTAL